MAVIADLLADQVQRGWTPSVACPCDGELASRTQGAGAQHIPWEARRSPGPWVISEALRLSRIIRSFAPDVIHLHSSKAGLAGRLAIRGRIPTLFQPHAWSFFAITGITGKAALFWEKFGQRWADAVICVSESERQFGIESGLKASWQIARNGISLDRWPAPHLDDRKNARRRLEVSEQASVVVCVGRVCYQKGQDLLVDAWPAVTENVPDAELYIVGDGPNLKQLQDKAGASIRFTGARSDVRDWCLAADVVAMPSRWEGLSIALLEAMATERAVIASDVTGMRETLS